jgi:hypothetical protein
VLCASAAVVETMGNVEFAAPTLPARLVPAVDVEMARVNEGEGLDEINGDDDVDSIEDAEDVDEAERVEGIELALALEAIVSVELEDEAEEVFDETGTMLMSATFAEEELVVMVDVWFENRGSN